MTSTNQAQAGAFSFIPETFDVDGKTQAYSSATKTAAANLNNVAQALWIGRWPQPKERPVLRDLWASRVQRH